MSDVGATPLRVGLFGVGRIGMHLLERFALGGPFRVVAACDDALIGPRIEPFDVKRMSPRELLAAPDIEVLWVTSSFDYPFDVGSHASLAGQHLIVESPFTLSAAVADQAIRAAMSRQRLLLVHQPRRADSEFRQALTVARESPIGAIRQAKFVSWSYGHAPRSITRLGERSETVESPSTTKIRIAAQTLDQLLWLVPSRPVRVFAYRDVSLASTSRLFDGDALALRIHFESACTADIDIRLDSPTPFQSGWLLTGERGGYAHGRQFTLTEEGEIYDSPVAPATNPAVADPFGWLAEQIRHGRLDADEATRTRTVVELLDAAQQSLEKGCEITLKNFGHNE